MHQREDEAEMARMIALSHSNSYPTVRCFEYDGQQFVLRGSANDPYFQIAAVDEPLRFAASRLGASAVVVDVGANIGLTSTVFAASGASAVHSFEPDPSVFERLNQTIDANQMRGVITPHQMALGQQDGMLVLFSNPTTASASHLVTAATLGQTEGVAVEVSTLDNFAKDLSRLDLIKIDVEGFEIDVLNGGAATIARLKPSLLIEFNSFTMIGFRDVNPRDVLRLLRQTFPYVHWFNNGQVRHIDGDAAELSFIHDHLLSAGCVDDLYCTFEPI